MTLEDATTNGVHLLGPGDLPPGPRRALAEALQGLYHDAGTPGVRRIADDVNQENRFRDTISHQKVADMLRGAGVPKWSKYEPVVRVLVDRSTPRRDPDEEVNRFKHLWDAATGNAAPTAADPSSSDHVSRLRSAFVLGGVTGETNHPRFEEAELGEISRSLGATIAKAGIDLIICSPFPDSADYYALRGYVESDTQGTVHMHSPRHPAVDDELDQLRAFLGESVAARIKNWHYPGPETDNPDSMGQAWLLCQLMAMEQADVVIAVGGKVDRTAGMLLHLAEARQQPVVPFAFLGGAAQRAYARRDWKRAYPGLDAGKLTKKDAVGDAIIIANQMAMARLRFGNGLTRPSTVFISRARVDVAYARALDRYLSGVGLNVLFGERVLSEDRTVEAAIEDAVLRSDLFIVLWSRSFAASRYCYDELLLAVRRHRAGAVPLWIINLDGSDVVPLEARTLPQVTARTPEELVSVVRARLASAD